MSTDVQLTRYQGTNRVTSGRNLFSWAEFDRLPRRLRDLINYAPINLGTRRATEALYYADLEKVMTHELYVVRQAVRRETAAIYGPDHPQATSP